MGTNYYLRTDVCECCGRERERIHIGKSSSGWPFLFRGYRKLSLDGMPRQITSADEWRAFLFAAIEQKGEIVDEYGRPHNLSELWTWITSKQGLTAGPDSCAHRHGSSDYEWYDCLGYRFTDREFS